MAVEITEQFVLFWFMLSVLSFADVETPNITCSGDQIIKADEDRPTAMLTWRTPTASDNSEYVPDVFCDPQSGTNFTIGETVVTCVAVDESKNTAECSFEVNVKGDYTIMFLLLKQQI